MGSQGAGEPGLGLVNTARGISGPHGSGLLAAQARRFVVGSPGDLRGRAWENMWEIEPAKRNEKHVSWCEGKRMQGQSIASMFPSSVAEKVTVTFCEAGLSPKPRLLQRHALGFFFCLRTRPQTTTARDHCGADVQNFHPLTSRLLPGNQLVCTLGEGRLV